MVVRQTRQSHIFSIASAFLLWLLVIAATALFGRAESAADPPSPGGAETPPATSPLPTVQDHKVGTVVYTGSHTWKGVIEVTADGVDYHDGTITAQVTGVPQGVTFIGDRRRVVFRNLEFRGVGDGMIVGNNQAVDDVVIDSCRFIDCRSPDAKSSDVLLGGRGYGVFAARGKNWTIRKTVFQTKREAPKPAMVDSAAAVPSNIQTADPDCSSQYAARFGALMGLNVQDCRFENYGKACIWLMFVHAAAFDRSEFLGGPIRIGSRPDDLPGIPKGDCRNIVFRNCVFRFGAVNDWPASIQIYPGTENVVFENCEFNTIAGCNWWMEVDERNTAEIHWKDCKWNGKPIEGYLGVRSSMSQEQMKAHNVGPAKE